MRGFTVSPSDNDLEAAARQLGVSVKTVGRWVGGETEPRMRDLRRIQELFGELPFP